MKRFILSVSLSLACLSTAAFAQSGAQLQISGSSSAPAVLAQSGSASARIAWQPSKAQRDAKDLGPVSPSQSLTIVLKLNRSAQQEQALREFNDATTEPGNPLYQKTLSNAEFTERFGIATSDMQAVVSWLESNGFKVDVADGGRRFVQFTGTAAMAQRTFQTPIHNMVATDGTEHFAATKAPTVPAWLASSVREIRGLENFSVLASPSYDGGVIVQSKQKQGSDEASAKRAPITDGVPAKAGEIEFHQGGTVITSSLAPEDQTDEAVLRREAIRPEVASYNANINVSLQTNTIAYASTQQDPVTSVLSWTAGNPTPTGTVTFYDSDGYLGVQILLSSCTAGTNQYTCNYTWNAASAATPSPDTIYAVYSGDTNYNSASATTSLTITSETGGGTFIGFASFTDNPTNQPYGNQGNVTLTATSGAVLSVGPPTGTLLIAGNGGIGSIFYGPTVQIGCLFDFLFCTFQNVETWKPSNTLLPGVYTLTAAYSGNGTFASAYSDTTYTVTGSGNTATTTTVSANPNYVNAANPGTTFTTVTSWSGTAAAPTGNLSLSYTGGGIGGAVFPITGAVNSIGSGNYDGGTYTFTYSCVTSTTGGGGSITCTITDSNLYALLNPGANTITATYAGNGIYHSSSGTTTVTESNNVTSATAITAVSNPTLTYGEEGSGFNETYTVTVSGRGGAYPTGTLTVTTTYQTTGGAVLGTQTVALTSCTGTRNGTLYTETCSVKQPVAPTTAGGTYIVVAKYGGDATYNGSTSAQSSFVINPQALTGGTGSIAPNPIAAATATAVTLTDSVTWIGAGNAPTAGNFYFTVNGVNYPATCTLGTLSYSCTATPTLTLNAGNYAVTFNFTTDGNYTLTQQAVGTLNVTSAANLSITIACTTGSSCGSTTTGVTSVGITATVKNSASGAASPTGTVTLTDATTGQTYQGTLVPGTGGNKGTSTVAFTITTGLAGGINSFTGAYASLTSNTLTTYVAGLLVSIDLKHTFSVDPGVIEGSPVCANPPSQGQTPGKNCTQGYGIQVYNFTSAAQAFNLSFTDAASGAFSYVTNCPASIAAGATCQLTFYYNPPFGDGTGSPTCTPAATCGFYEQATWSLAGNSGTLTGIGYKSGSGLSTARSGATSFPAILAGKAVLQAGSVLSVTPLSINFGTVAVNQQAGNQNVTVKNTGTAPVGITYTLPSAPYIVTNNCPTSLAGGAQCTIIVTAKSATVTSAAGSIVITPAQGSVVTVNLSVAVVNKNGITLNANQHNFGSVTLNSTNSFALGITNSSASSQTLGFSNASGAGFTVNSAGCPASLAAGASCTVNVTYSPSAPGSSTDTLTITSSAIILPGGTSSAPYSVGVVFTGTGTSSSQFTATTSVHDWGTVPVGSAGTNYGVVLTNSTSTALTLTFTGLSSTTTGFSVVTNNCPATLAVNASCNLIFGFKPVSPGYVSASYPISAKNPSSVNVPLYSLGSVVTGINLSGTGQ